MLILCAMAALGSLQFSEEPLPGLRIDSVTPFTGVPATNYLHADLNEDGLVDIILPDAVYFQSRGKYPEDSRESWPDIELDDMEADVFGPALYIRTASLLCVFTHSEGRWDESIRQPLDWPNARLDPPAGALGTRPVQFRRFLFDIDGDNTPELVDLDGAGVQLFRLANGRYENAGTLDILPSMTLAPAATHAIWPPEQRRIVLPEQEMSCRLLLTENAMTLITRTDVPGGQTYHRETITLSATPGQPFEEAGRSMADSAPIPPHARPCQLNQDDILDFAGGRWTLSETSPVPAPIYETWASLDGGATFHIERATTFQHFRPACSFVDFDNDGDLDMVAESTGIFAGGVRETVNRYLTSSSLPHRLRIIEQNAGGYRNTNTIDFPVEIALGAPPVSGGAMLNRYQAGLLLNIMGDFNGDGFKDLVIRDRESRLAIYLADGWKGFQSEPATTMTAPANSEFSVGDINGDGFADLLLSWEETTSAGVQTRTTAYYAKHGDL